MVSNGILRLVAGAALALAVPNCSTDAWSESDQAATVGGISLVPSNITEWPPFTSFYAAVTVPDGITAILDSDTGEVRVGWNQVRPPGTGYRRSIGFYQLDIPLLIIGSLDTAPQSSLRVRGHKPLIVLVMKSAVLRGTVDLTPGSCGDRTCAGGGAGGPGAAVYLPSDYDNVSLFGGDGVSGGVAGSRLGSVCSREPSGSGGGGGPGGPGVAGTSILSMWGGPGPDGWWQCTGPVFPVAGGRGGYGSGGGSELVPLRTGSGGAGALHYGPDGNFAYPFEGGGGGGALQISVLERIEITGTAHLAADGAPGSESAGGGGGGGLLIESPYVAIVAGATLTARGGGACHAACGSGGRGGDGGPGAIRINAVELTDGGGMFSPAASIGVPVMELRSDVPYAHPAD